MRYEQISAAITRVVAVITAVRGFIGTETFVSAFRLHLSDARMSLGMLCYSSPSDHPDSHPDDSGSGNPGAIGLKRNINSAAKRQGLGKWRQQYQLLPAISPAARLGLANC